MIKYVSGLVLVLMGFMDCLTTVVGTQFFGTQELNPLIAGLVNSNVLGFVVLKVVVTVCVGLVFVLAQRTLLGNANESNRSFKVANNALIAVYIGLVLFLFVVVLNNVIVIVHVLI